MKKHQLCRDCINCKTKDGEVYCKFGVFKEKIDKLRPILHIPQDFNCTEYEEA
jgi:hypothetical protein